MKEKLQPVFRFIHTIRFQMIAAVIFAGIVLTIVSLSMFSFSMDYVEKELIDSRLKSDIACLRENLSDSGAAVWSRKGTGLYADDILLGDGDPEHANLAVLKHYEDLTGTFFYLFVRTENDDELSWIEDGQYMQGHYLRVAGTTLGPRNERLEGTYIDKAVADAIESAPDGTFSGEANVNGRPIYCRYELLRSSTGEVIGIISDGRSVAEMRSIVKDQKLTAVLAIGGLTLAVVVSLAMIAFSMSRSVKKINVHLHEIGSGKFPEEPLAVTSGDEFSDIAASVNEMERSLRDKKRIETELSEKNFDLQIAASIQMSMLPEESRQEAGRYSLFASMTPAKEVGGDFYDHFMTDDTHLAFLAADVSGKGTPAALFMMRAITTIRSYAASGLSLEEIMNRTNFSLCENNKDGYFVTAWLGILDLTSGKLSFVNAGHTVPVLKKEDGSAALIQMKRNIVLGVFEKFSYKAESMQLSKGDLLFLYTDGVTEAQNSDRALFGDDRLLAAAAGSPDMPEDFCGEMLAAVNAFSGDAPQFDDITMLAVKYEKTENS